jgi:hydroxymethylbilane synthase
VAAITDSGAFACLLAERALARELEADCDTPLGAHALPEPGDGLLLRAWVGLPDGSRWVVDELAGERADPDGLGRAIAARLKSVGAGELLEAARGAAVDGA